MNTAHQVDAQLSKLWSQRSLTRGYPKWERIIAAEAIKELEERGHQSRLRNTPINHDRYATAGEMLFDPQP